MRTRTLLILPLTICLFLFFSCNEKGSNTTAFDPNDTIQGRKVMKKNDDHTPKVVYYYDVDKNGNLTDKKKREVHYFPGKKIYIEGNIKNDQRDGEWAAYYENGHKNVEAFYKEGKEDGDYRVYYENGKLMYSGHYTNGICDKEWSFYAVNGTLDKRMTADDNTVICGTCARCREVRQKK